MSEEKRPSFTGTHVFPGGLSTALSLAKPVFEVGGKAGSFTMASILAGESSPSGTVDMYNNDSGSDDLMLDDSHDERSPPPGQGTSHSSHIVATQVSLDLSMTPISGLGGQSQQGAPAVTTAVDQHVSKPGTGQSGLRGSQPAPPQARSASNKSPASKAPLLNRGWEDVAGRMATISLLAAGRPYKREHIELAMLNSGMDCSQIVTLGEFQRNFKYQVTFATKDVADYFIREYPTLSVKTDKGDFECPVSSFLRREYRIKVSWFPDAGEDGDLARGLAQYGEVIAIQREKIKGPFGHYYSGNRIVTIIPTGDIDNVPDFKDMRAHGDLYTTRLTVMGLKPRCHNCHVRGHVASRCGACSRCGSAQHRTADHPNQVPVTTFAERVKGTRRGAPEYVPGEIDEMECEGGEPRKSAAKSAPNVTGKKPEQSQQPGPDQVEPSTESKVQPMVDTDGFRLVTQDKRAKRRRSHNGKSRDDGTTSQGEGGDTDVSDTEGQEHGVKNARTEPLVHQEASPDIVINPVVPPGEPQMPPENVIRDQGQDEVGDGSSA